MLRNPATLPGPRKARAKTLPGHWLNMTKQLGNLLRFAAKLWTPGRFQLVSVPFLDNDFEKTLFFASCAYNPSVSKRVRDGRQAHHPIGPRKEGSMMWWQVLEPAVAVILFPLFATEVSWTPLIPWITNWWFQPIWKILVKLDHFPK